jgi:hypothetical protein
VAEVEQQTGEAEPTHRQLARVVWFAFLRAFVAARVSVRLAESFSHAERILEPKLLEMEQVAPR